MTIIPVPPISWYAKGARVAAHGVPEGYDAAVIAAASRALADQQRVVVHIVRNDSRMAMLNEALALIAPDAEVFTFPAWDCLPYDRVSPQGEIVGRRLDTLISLLSFKNKDRKPRILITTVSAILQRVLTPADLQDTMLTLSVGDRIKLEELNNFLVRTGHRRTSTVREPGDYAVRGGIVDVFPSGANEPFRLDFFGDEIDRIRVFDSDSQLSFGNEEKLYLKPVSEVMLNDGSIQRFCAGYIKIFGPYIEDDNLYTAVKSGQRYHGIEHWQPLFYEKMTTLFEYLPGAVISQDYQVDEAIHARFEQISEFYESRQVILEARKRGVKEKFADGAPYNPLPPDKLYLTKEEWIKLMDRRPVAGFIAGPAPEGVGRVDFGGRLSREFSDIRVRSDLNLFTAVKDWITGANREGKCVLVAGQSKGARDRLYHLLQEHGLTNARTVDLLESNLLVDGKVWFITLNLERGFTAGNLVVISESDILGDRLIRAVRKKRGRNFLNEINTFAEGDLIVHTDHGIGRYDGLVTLEIGEAPHDCLQLVYAGGDKLFVPVENIDVITRYGSEETGTQLDKLGGVAWQSRKARIRKHIQDMAGKLIQIAASREVQTGENLVPPDGLYDEFSARFPYVETDDQAKAIEDMLSDMRSGKLMDRLVCGDVGFGKTEIAIRAAFVAAIAGLQVAVVVPTTLLARQHYQNFAERFKILPVKVAQLSRLVPDKQRQEIKKDLAEGRVDIVIGTHALLAKGTSFNRLGLLIIDEEQHFGVAQKERLKELKSNIHVLTLTATPIPRTLQMALAGVRDMSIIATPPVDRLAVRTFVLPYDPFVVREAIMREHFRGGQVFYVCPRLEDLSNLTESVKNLVPEARIIVAHGRLTPANLEDAMRAFVEGRYNVLISTNIVESGLDIPTANTMIIHRSDMFGLAQLYQLRGRIGRAKTRGYCYLTLPIDRQLTVSAQRRLEVMQTLDQLGAGFQLASHDMDIRGAGNLLGEEQSGHVKEVGIELYQHLLEEAVLATRNGVTDTSERDWSPAITVGTPVLIPEHYVADLAVRLSLYRRISSMVGHEEIDSFAAEMIDRFGPLPQEVENLLQLIEIKHLCRVTGVEKVDAGPKGAIMQFRNNKFSDPEKLIAFINDQSGTVKVRPDHKLVFIRGWNTPKDRIAGVHHLMQKLSEIAVTKS